MTAEQAYEALIRDIHEIALLGSILSLLGWDEQTHLPPAGAEHRANQSAYVARMRHEKLTAPRIGELLSAVESSDLVREPDSDAAANIRELRRDYDRARKLPALLVEELSRTEVLAQQAWTE